LKEMINSTVDLELQRASLTTLLLRVTGRVEPCRANANEYVPGKPQQYRLVEPETFCVESEQRIDETFLPELLAQFPDDTWVGRVAECFLDPVTQQYRIKNIRTDKEHPNTALTVFITKINMVGGGNTHLCACTRLLRFPLPPRKSCCSAARAALKPMAGGGTGVY
jgi:hypothetical protein